MIAAFETADIRWFGAAEPPPFGDSETPQPATGNHAEGLRILIVEDEFFIALDIQSQVEALGHAVVGIAVSADQAVEMAGREHPDLVLMDIRLSGVRDGIDAAVEIRERYGVPSIFVTANTDPATLQRAEATKPLGVLNKPLTQLRLMQELARLNLR